MKSERVKEKGFGKKKKKTFTIKRLLLHGADTAVAAAAAAYITNISITTTGARDVLCKTSAATETILFLIPSLILFLYNCFR